MLVRLGDRVRFQRIRWDRRACGRQRTHQRRGLAVWETRLFSAGWEAQYFNFEATRQERLDAETVTEIQVFDGSVQEQYTDGTLVLPDAATMAGFDTMEFDILMECPDRDQAEFGNCGAWDYLGHVWLRDAADENWLEMGRIITTYHRESRWIMDASWALAWLQDGGERTIRYEWAPSWNKQPTGITLSSSALEPRQRRRGARARTDLLGRRAQQQLQPARARHRHRSGERHPDQARRRDHRTRDGHAELRRVLRPLTPLHAR